MSEPIAAQLMAVDSSSQALQMVQPPRRIGLAAKLVGLCFVLGPLVLLLVPWQQNLRGYGRVVAFAPLDRQQQIEAPVDGRITRWWVQEGSIVSAGDPLLEITDVDPNLVARLAQEKIALQAKLEAYIQKVQSYRSDSSAAAVT